jgi:Fur family ferric uptake transcriptional regulator
MMQKRLKAVGYKMTQGRKTIMDILIASEGHLSAEDIYFKAHSVQHTLSLASVYRTLEIFVKMGLVNKFNFKDGGARYELAESPGGRRHHHHLICTSCGIVIDYGDFSGEELNLLRQTEKHLSVKYGFTIANHTVHYYGLCEECNKNE